jgi:hypothetical protein
MVGQRLNSVGQSGVNVVFVLNVEAIGHVDTDDLTLAINDTSVRVEDPSATDVVHPVSCLTEGGEVTFTNIVVKKLSSAIRYGSRSHNVVTLKKVQSEHGWLVGEVVGQWAEPVSDRRREPQ